MQILAGKDKGKQGRVSMVMRPRNAVIVEGLNAVSTVCVCVCVCACACIFDCGGILYTMELCVCVHLCSTCVSCQKQGTSLVVVC